MKNLLNDIKISAIVTAALTLIVCFIFPFLIFAIGELLFSHQANGSLIHNEKKQIIGSKLIGQNFTQERYFHPRPSAAGSQGYDAMLSGGSNLGPTSKEYVKLIKERAANYRSLNNIPANVPIPIDPLTTSGSGLDPHITFDNALLQAERVAKARSLPINTVIQLIESVTEEPFLNIFGSKRVNVLLLNKKLNDISQ